MHNHMYIYSESMKTGGSPISKREANAHTQAKKATKKNSHCFPLSIMRRRKGLGASCMGGRRLEKRVRAYSLMLISWGACDSVTALPLLAILGSLLLLSSCVVSTSCWSMGCCSCPSTGGVAETSAMVVI